MKEDLKYMRLGEVTNQISDGSHNPPKGIEFSDYPMLSSKNIFFDRYDYESPRYLSKEDFEIENKRTSISEGDVLLTIVGTVGRTCCIGQKFKPFTLQRSVAVLKPKKNIIDSRYLMYSLHSLSDLWENEAKGVAQKGVYLKQVSNIRISIPSVIKQKEIVSELDLLSSIIKKQKLQVEEMDKLAQSIFYETFGDPITNEKGWDMISIGSVCYDKKEIIRANKKYSDEDMINYIDISSINNESYIIESTTSYIFKEAPSRAQQVVNYGDILISTVRPNLKNIAIVNSNNNCLVASSGFCVLRTAKVEKEYLMQVLKSESFTNYLLKLVTGANYPAVREDDIKNCKIGIPPLSFQQEFVAKIEAIESIKAKVRQSLKETEQLFNSRMDYYFND